MQTQGIVLYVWRCYPPCIHRLYTILCYNTRDVRGTSAKILLGFLVVALIAPTLFVARPQKAEALVSLAQCFAAKRVAQVKAATKGLIGGFQKVPVIDKTVNSTAAVAPAGTDWASCFMKGFAVVLGKAMLHTFTQSIVNWINTGFNGSPSFVTNPEGFLTDVADQTIGRIVEDISPLLCSPFRLDIRFALGLNLSLRTRQEIHCRLSDVLANVRGAYDGFVQGTVGSGNLSRWINIAGTPQNNPYGAYIAASYDIGFGITSATGQQVKLLDWGKGFKSWRSCKRWGNEVKDANGRVIRKGVCVEEGEIKTPGSIIESQTTGALATTFHELELAKEIDEVVGALVNQMLVQAMTGVGGLLGASKGSILVDGQRMSATAALLTDPEKALAISDAQTPPGINCSLRYYPSTKTDFRNGRTIYVPDEGPVYVPGGDTTPVSSDQVWTDKLGNEGDSLLPDEVAASLKRARAINPARELIPVMKPRAQSWAAYFAGVKAGCANKGNTLLLNTSTKALSTSDGVESGEGLSATPPKTPPPSIEGNLALGKEAAQSSTWPGRPVKGGSFPFVPTAEKAVDGETDGIYRYSSTNADPGRQWWRIDLETQKGAQKRSFTETKISEIRVYSPFHDGGFNNVGDFSANPYKIFVSDTELGDQKNPAIPDVGSSSFSSGNGNLSARVTFPILTPKSGRYVYIVSDFPDIQLSLAEVEVYGSQSRIDESNPVTPAEAPFSFAVHQGQTPMLAPEPGSLFILSGLAFTPNKAGEGISLRARVYTCINPSICTGNDVEYNSTPVSFVHLSPTDSFTSLRFRYTKDSIETVRSAVMPSVAGYIYTDEVVVRPEGSPPADATEVFFVTNASVKEQGTISVSITGSLTRKMPFRIVIDALDLVGSLIPNSAIKVNFVLPEGGLSAPPPPPPAPPDPPALP